MPVKGSCHCGATQFEVASAPEAVTRCTCTICTKRGALWAYYSLGDFKLVTAKDAVATYRWQSGQVAHHFCSTCGCGTFSETPDWSSGEPDETNMRVAVNTWALDDFDPLSVPVVVLDGRNEW